MTLIAGRGATLGAGAVDAAARGYLTERGYVGREDGAALDTAYRFLRTLEHRLQLGQLRRTHVLPEDGKALRRIGRAMGLMKDPVEALDREWRRRCSIIGSSCRPARRVCCLPPW